MFRSARETVLTDTPDLCAISFSVTLISPYLHAGAYVPLSKSYHFNGILFFHKTQHPNLLNRKNFKRILALFEKKAAPFDTALLLQRT
jgi:hypothetical protein